MTDEIKKTETTESPIDKTRSAKDYAEAVEAVAGIAAVAIQIIPGLGKFRAVGTVATALPKAAKAIKAVAPALENPIVSEAIEKTKEVAPDAAKVALSKTSEVKDAALKPVLERKAAAEAAKARKAARRSVIGAAEAMTIPEFEKRQSTYRSLSEGDGLSYLGQPGCYVFILGSKGIKRDLADYREVYVGSSEHDMGLAISHELEGLGNVDVYADAKYGQNLHILPYPCAADKVSELKASLVIALDANVSYNARD